MTRVPVIAIDGPSGVGKSTAARRVAAELGYYFLSSGMIYRAMALHLMRRGWDGKSAPDACGVADLALRIEPDGSFWLAGQNVTGELRSERISQAASVLSTVPEIRGQSNAIQQDVVQHGKFPGVVLEGRDIGTVVFPDARHKFFLTASAEVRAERRFRELAAAQPNASRDAVLAEMRERDARDAGREVAPLVKAPDAKEIDTSHRTLDEVVQLLLHEVQSPH